MKVACVPKGVACPARTDLRYVLYDHASDPAMGSIGAAILPKIKRLEICPAPRAWDFLSIALAVTGADEGCARSDSADGWAREIDLTVSVSDPRFWTGQKETLTNALRFLTTDRWNLTFIDGGVLPAPPTKRPARPEDVVCLLSGGLDSLIGALDLRANGANPVLVSQTAIGDKTNQQYFARTIAGNLLHLQLNHHTTPPPGFSERSQRARSLLFFAYGVLGATSLDRHQDGHALELFVPENGFISLNVPLTPMRLASHSTRTTHPFFVAMVQSVLEAARLRVRLTNPYQFMTKGEMLSACKDQSTLIKFAAMTTSCGRFARNSFTHCGRCIPCLIRRAAFQHWGTKDLTPYRYENLGKPGPSFRDFDDVRSAAVAIETVRTRGVDAWIGGALNFAQIGDVTPYRDVVSRGIAELQVFLQIAGVM